MEKKQQPEKNKNNKLVILYATQTGNAQDVAERMGREARRNHLQPLVVSMHAYNPSFLPGERYVLFVVSTTGQGDPPDSMRGFWKFLLRKSLGHQWLAGTQFAVFGLGDSGYQKYNVVAKKLDRRLLDLGGKPLLVKGLGDDQHPFGFEAGLDPWLASLWLTLREQIPLPVGLQDPTPGDTGLGFLPPPPVSITEFYLLWSNFRVCNLRELAAGAFLQICVDVCAI
jgi:sulfite reductase alpha subunit-like flavoprotein